MQHSAEAAAEESDRTFSKLIHAVEKWSGEATELIRLQEKLASAQADKLLEKLQKEMVELREADGALMNLSRTEDHVKFLKVGSKRRSGGGTAPSIPHILLFSDTPN